ncbi:MAG: hypothetical protein Q9163_006232 [Psora crenata]
MVAASLLTKALLPAFLSAQVVLAQGSCSVKNDVTFTFFGLGSAGVFTKFGCSGTSVKAGSETAIAADGPRPSGGDGSYDHPALFATAESNTAFQRCEIIYIPYLKKYFQFGDICVQCDTDFAGGLTHVDLWIGPNPEPSWTDQTIPQALRTTTGTCEGAWGKIEGMDIIHNPPTDLEVQPQTLDDGTTCYNTDTSRFFPNNAGSCSGGNSGGSNAPPHPTSSVPPSYPSPPSSSSASSSHPAPSPSDAPSSHNNPPSNEGHSSDNGIPDVNTVLAPENPSPSSTSAAAMPTTTAPTGEAPPIGQKLAVVDNEGSNEESTPTTVGLVTPSSESGNSTGQPGEQCPDGGWFQGCVWGSGNGNLGDTCTGKTDCKGEWICVAGKCADNTRGKIKPRAAGGLHIRRVHKHMH